jgi:hypothetical protein
MDYIALNHNSERAKGVIYNSSKPIGGIYYQGDRESPVTVEKDPATGRKQAFVEIERKFAQKEKEYVERNKEEIKKIGEQFAESPDVDFEKKEVLISEKIEELNNERTLFEKRIEKQKRRELKRAQRIIAREHDKVLREIAQKKAAELKQQLQAEALRNGKYIITISDETIDFTQEGIQKAILSLEDQEWLAKAQNHFITAQEDGIRIGSAEEYTSMEALEALWSTAVHVGIDPKRFIVQIYNESRFNPSAKGAAGERGIGQFKKTTAEAYGYDWYTMKSGLSGYAYQAKAAAEFVHKVGEIAYNGSGEQARKYQERINKHIRRIENSSTSCALSNIQLCISKS